VLEARRQAEKAKAEEAERARIVAELQKRAENDRQQMAALQQRIEAEKAERTRREAELAKQQAEIARQRQREETERQRRQTAERAAQRRRLIAGAGTIGALMILVLAIWQPWRDRNQRGTLTPAATGIAVAQLTEAPPTDGSVSGNTRATSMLPTTAIAALAASPTPKLTPTPRATPLPTDTPSPSLTPTATPTVTSTPTATPTRTKSPTPRPSPAITGTPAPSPEAVIVPENAAQIEELARWNISARAKQVAYSPDGKLLAIANDKTVTCYDPTTLVKVCSVTVDDPITAVAFSPDGNTMALVAGKSVRIWHLGESTARRMQTEQPGIRDLVISRDGQSVVGLSDKIYTWNIADGSQQLAFGDGEYGTGIMLSPDGKYLALSGTRGGVPLWRSADGTLAHRLVGSRSYSESKAVAFAPDGLSVMAILAGSGNGYIYGASYGAWMMAPWFEGPFRSAVAGGVHLHSD
jgi:hypothetical protein